MTDAPSPGLYAVLGNPVAQSRSPFIHDSFARQTGQSIRYQRILCPLDGFAAALQDAAEAGLHGCNVTVPFKFEALAAASRRSERAALAGAANLLRREADGWYADNSDGVGLRRDIEQGAGVPIRGQRVLLVGAGGAGAGVLGPLLEARPAELVLANRRVDRARALLARHLALAQAQGVTVAAVALDDPGRAFDLVINASASSLQGAGVPVPASVLRPGALAVDLMYGAPAAPFLAWAEAAGARGRDGLGMLVEQAAESFLLWRGVRPQTAPVLKALRRQLEDPDR